MQRPITKVNLLSWSKAVSRRLQKEINTSLEKSIEQDGGFQHQGEQVLSWHEKLFMQTHRLGMISTLEGKGGRIKKEGSAC
jgi:hypothetical protein